MHSDNNAERMKRQLERVAQGLVGYIGVAAQKIGDKEALTLNGDEHFVMASTFKVAIATTLLDRVEKGELKLDQLIDITLDTMVAGDNILAQNFVHSGVKLSVANLIEVMITESDNTATDICIKLAGGPAAVTKKLRNIGITDQRVDRLVAEILRDFYELPDLATATVVAEVLKKDPALASRLPNRNLDYEKDPRDQSTPTAMLELLLAIDRGKALSPNSRAFLLDSMSRTRTGKGRLKGLLPKGTPVAHKTGTIGGVANDVGYVTLSDGRRFAIAVFTKSSTTPETDRERAIAEVARTIYDYYNMNQ